MKKILIIVLVAAILAMAGCSTSKTNELKLTATAEKFEKDEYIIKKGQQVTLVFDSNDLISQEIKGMSVKLDKIDSSKEIKPDSPGVYDIIGNLGEGKLIKSKLTVTE